MCVPLSLTRPLDCVVGKCVGKAPPTFLGTGDSDAVSVEARTLLNGIIVRRTSPARFLCSLLVLDLWCECCLSLLVRVLYYFSVMVLVGCKY